MATEPRGHHRGGPGAALSCRRQPGDTREGRQPGPSAGRSPSHEWCPESEAVKVPVGPEVHNDADGPAEPGQRPREATPPCRSPCDRDVGLRRADTFPDVAIRGDAVVGAGPVVTNNVALGVDLQPSVYSDRVPGRAVEGRALSCPSPRSGCVGPRLLPMWTLPGNTDDVVPLFDELLDLVPTELHPEPGEVFYSGATAFAQPSLLYLLGFNPGGDPARAELSRYTIAADLAASRAPLRREWSGFEDDWRDFGPGPSPSNVGFGTCSPCAGSGTPVECRRATPCLSAARAFRLSAGNAPSRFFATAGPSTRRSFRLSEYGSSSVWGKRRGGGSGHRSVQATGASRGVVGIEAVRRGVLR